MHPHAAAALWFCLLAVVPQMALTATFEKLRRERTDPASGARMHPRVWLWSGADPRSYTARGRTVLRVHKLLQAAFGLAWLVWGAVFLF